MAAVCLFPRQVIMDRLALVDSIEYVQRRFHPHIAAMGGEQVHDPADVILRLVLLIDTFTQSLPSEAYAAVYVKIPAYLRCLTDDVDFLALAEERWESLNASGV